MAFSRYTESQLRDLLNILGLPDASDPDAVAKRLEQLQRGLAPEDEFALLASWLGRCKLIHKLGQEQLPLSSIEAYRVPDLLAIFERDNRLIPVLIEVKTTDRLDAESLNTATLSLKPHYLQYAAALKLPMLIAWRIAGLWTLFEMRHATVAETNYKIGFRDAMRQNLMSILAGDFSYRLVAGTALNILIRKTSEGSESEGFSGIVGDTFFTSPTGERLPRIRLLDSLFLVWPNEQRSVENGDSVNLRYVITDEEINEFASRTLGQIVAAFAALGKETGVNWRAVTHDTAHFAHDVGMLRDFLEECTKFGVVTGIIHFQPQELPSFL